MIASGVTAVASLRGIPVVTWSQDIYPDLAVAFGLVTARHPVTRTLTALQAATYRRAARVVAISEGMARRLQSHGVPSDRVRVIPNWADGSVLRPIDHSDNPFRREHGLDARFVAMYSGNLGEGHDVATFV